MDLGASWIHGIGPGAGSLKGFKGRLNPISEICQANEIRTLETWADEEETEVSYYSGQGKLKEK